MAGIPFLSKILALAGIGVKDQADNKEAVISVSPSQTPGSTISLELPASSGTIAIKSEVVLASEKAAANGVATLDAGGKIPSAQLPPLSITEVFVVSSEAAMLALDAQVGDVAVRTDISETFILSASPASTLSNWVELLETSGVVSVNGKTGVVSLSTTDISEGSNLYFTDARAQAAITGAASTIVTAGLTAERALISNGSGKVAVSSVTSTELSYLAGVSSGLQSQIDGKVSKSGDTMTGNLVMRDSAVIFANADADAWVGFKAPASPAGTLVWTLPAGDGSAGQVLATDGAGILSWSTISVPVTSVNGKTGDVVLTTTDIAEGTNLYFTDARAKSAAVIDSMAGSQTDQAPSVSSVKSYVTSAKEVFFYANQAAFPAVGQSGNLYISEAVDKIYRFKQTSTPITPVAPATPAVPAVFDHIVGPTGSFATLEAALASPSVIDGQTIQIQASTYTVSSTININKKVKIYGAGKTQSVFVTAGTGSDPVSMLNVSVDDVLIYGIGLQHKKTTNTSVESALVVSGPGFPQTRVANFIIDSCRIEHVEFGMTIRGSAWKIANTDFVYKGPNNSTRRHVGIYGTLGNCFAVNNTSNEDILPGVTGNTRWFTPTSTTGTNPNETYEGQLVIQGNTQAGGNLAQFYSQDSWEGSAGGFKLFINNNTTNENNAFVSLYGGATNFGNILSEITIVQNSISNNHGSGGGKGLIGIDGVGSIAFRSSSLPVHQSDNVLGQLVFRSGYLEATGSTGSLVGYNTVGVTPAPVVALDSNVSVVTNEYIELSKSPVLSVNGKTGSVVLTTTDIAEGTNLYFTDARAQTAAVVDSTAGSETNKAASVAAMKSYVGSALSPLELYKDAQLVMVSKSGNDSTGTGGQHKPYLTIGAALASITDASPTKRYVIKVQAGAYTEGALALKANVFIVGENKESVRISASSYTLASDFTGSADNRSGMARVLLASGNCDFNWQTVTSSAGKLYFTEVSTNGSVSLYGHNNAIAQAQFDSCIFFGALNISGINVGVFNNNICYGNITLSQHPNGGMASILAATGGQCNGTLTLNATTSDFSRRCSLFAKNFYCEYLTINGPSAYADVNEGSLPRSRDRVVISNGGNYVPITMKSPAITDVQTLGEPGYQWLYTFNYVNASTNSDLYLISMGGSYAAASVGRSIHIEADSYGLTPDVNGGDIILLTSAVSGTGIRGKIQLDAREIDASSAKITNLAAGSASTDAVNKGQLDSVSSRVDKLEASRGVYSGSLSTGATLDITSLVPTGAVEYPIVQVYKVESGVNQQVNFEFSFNPTTKVITFGSVSGGPITAVIHVLALTSPLTTL